MFKLNLKLLFGVAAMLLWSQQNAWADGWRHAERGIRAPEYWRPGGEFGRGNYRQPSTFYKPVRPGHVVIDASMGTVVSYLPRYNRVAHWQGRPYYVVGNSFYRKHPRGYVVIPDPRSRHRW